MPCYAPSINHAKSISKRFVETFYPELKSDIENGSISVLGLVWMIDKHLKPIIDQPSYSYTGYQRYKNLILGFLSGKLPRVVTHDHSLYPYGTSTHLDPAMFNFSANQLEKMLSDLLFIIDAEDF